MLDLIQKGYQRNKCRSKYCNYQRRYCYIRYRLNMSKNKERGTETMEKMSELTISDVKELTQGRKVKLQMESAMSIQMTEAIVIADPDSGNDGKIAILMPDTGCKIELDSEELIETIYGNENEITIKFFNNMGSMEIFIVGDAGSEADHIINQDELCQYIKDRLDRLSRLTIEDIDLVLNMEMEYLQSKGIVD